MRFIKTVSALLLLFAVMLCFASCKDDPDVVEDVYYTVTFNTAGGTEMESLRVLAGSRISKPADPEKEGYIFSSWKNGTIPWDFENDTVNSDVTLNAVWLDVRNLFEYRVEGGEVIITGFKGSMSSVHTPAVIDGLPVVAIADYAFENFGGGTLAQITITENICSIGEGAFANAETLIIHVEAKPEYIGPKAFLNCQQLERIELGNGLKEIPFEAFSGCTALKEVILSDTVEKIAENAFELCSALDTVVAHESLKIVEDSAFVDCDALRAVCYYGTAESWAETVISEGNHGNDSLIAAKLYIYSESEPTVEGDFWYFSKDGRIRVW